MFAYTKPPVGTQINPLHPLSRGLVGCWLFNEGAGSLANDISGNKNHGRLTNMVPNVQGSGWGGSKFGGGLDYDGANDYVKISQSAMSINLFTLSFWEFTTDGVGYFICDSNDPGNFFMRRGSLVTETVDMGIGGTSWKGGSNPITLSYDTWHNHTITHNSTGVYEWYIDGVSQGTTTGSSFTGLNNSLYLGNRQDLLRPFAGSVDSVRIYNRILSATDIKQLYDDPFCMMMKRPINRYYTAVAAGFQNGAAMMMMGLM